MAELARSAAAAPVEALPTVAVVVATRHRPHLLPPLVDAVLADPHAEELIVVVDGDEDPHAGGEATSVAVLERLAATRPRLVVVATPHLGHLGALELGVARARAEVVLLLDDDVVPCCHLAEGHARRHAGTAGLVVAGSMPVALADERPGGGTLLYARDYERHTRCLRAGTYGVLDHLWMGNVSLRRADARAIGLASSAFTASYHEDQELGLRLARAGLRGVFDEDLAAVHLHRRSTAAFLGDARRHGAGLVALHRLHGDLLGPFDVATVVADLPPVVRALVRRAGASPTAVATARRWSTLGARLGRLGLPNAERNLAQLARRAMVYHGACYGEQPLQPV